jgi:hypothetical protein
LSYHQKIKNKQASDRQRRKPPVKKETVIAMKFEFRYVWDGLEDANPDDTVKAAYVRTDIAKTMSRGGRVKSLRMKIRKLHAINSTML